MCGLCHSDVARERLYRESSTVRGRATFLKTHDSEMQR